MTERLHDQFAFDAQAGEDLYDARAASLTTRARSRVRRARTMRAAGTGALAAVVIGIAAVGVAWGGGRDGVAPAVSPSATASSSPTPTVADRDARVTADRLASSASPRERGVAPDVERQEAALCEGPWPEPGSNGIVFDECAAVWVGDGWVMDAFATVSFDAVTSQLVIGWEIANATDEPLAFDGDSVAIGLVSDPEGRSTGASVSRQTVLDTSLWLSDTTRGMVLGGDSEEMVVPAHQVRSGVAIIPVAAPAEGEDADVAYLVATGAVDPWVVVQARLLPSEGDVGRALVLETTTLPAAAELATTADDLRGVAQPRNAEDFDRGAAQAGLDCVMDPTLNPRLSEIDQGAFFPICDAVWLTDDSPLLELRDMTVDYDAVSGEVTVNWTVGNASGGRIQIDRGSVAVAVETGSAPELETSTSVELSEGGSLVGDSLWVSPTERYGFVTRESSVEELEPNQLFGGSTTIDGLSEEDLSGIRASLLVRIPARDDLDGAQELLLELHWQR